MTEMASRTAASGNGAMADWLSSWTIFYWAWWVSWTPFVGMFIARISRGRAIRRFVTGVLLVPSLVSLVWFAIFGGAAIDVQRRTGELVGKGGVVNTDAALFQLLDQYPLASASSVLTIVAALPFVLVMSALCLSLYLDLKTDPMILRGQIGIELVEEAVVQGVQTHGDEFGLVLESADTDTVSDEFDKDRISVRTGRE